MNVLESVSKLGGDSYFPLNQFQYILLLSFFLEKIFKLKYTLMLPLVDQDTLVHVIDFWKLLR